MVSRSRKAAVALAHQPWIHQALPTPVTRALISTRARRAWQNPRTRQQALLQMRFLLGESSRAGEIESLAAAYVFESYKRAEYRWQPRRTNRHPVENIELIDEAGRAGIGVLLSFMHHGQFGIAPSLSRAGIAVHLPVWNRLVEAPTPAQRQLHRTISRGPVTFPAKGSFPHMLDLLRRGETIMLSNDLPGSLPGTFLGRTVGAASGLVRLAQATGAPILPVTVRPSSGGWRQVVVIEEAIDPRAFPEPEALQTEVLRRHEPAVLAWPEAVENPLRRWNPVTPEDVREFSVATEIRDTLLI